jgi:cytochrome c oxidase cbb3-type subunit 3
MSDFVSSGWSLYVAGVTILGLVLCLVLLAVASKRKVMANDNSTGSRLGRGPARDEQPAAALVGVAVHPHGGLRRRSTWSCIPAWAPTKASLKWSSAGQHQAEVDKARATMAPLYAKFVSLPAEALAKDAQAMAIGERLFANNCAGCHGADARGSKGFPNLADNDWLYGWHARQDQGEHHQRPPGRDAADGRCAGDCRGRAQRGQVRVEPVGQHAQRRGAQLGKAKFAVCAACHGPDGKGNQALGAPNLTDKIWLHGWGEEAIVAMITNGKTNVMPAQAPAPVGRADPRAGGLRLEPVAVGDGRRQVECQSPPPSHIEATDMNNDRPIDRRHRGLRPLVAARDDVAGGGWATAGGGGRHRSPR